MADNNDVKKISEAFEKVFDDYYIHTDGLKTIILDNLKFDIEDNSMTISDNKRDEKITVLYDKIKEIRTNRFFGDVTIIFSYGGLFIFIGDESENYRIEFKYISNCERYR